MAAAVFVGIHSPASLHGFVHADLPVLLVPFLGWLFLSERYDLTVGVFVFYLLCADGVVKLEAGSEIGTLGRDVILYAISLGAIARIIIRKQRPTPPRMSGLLWAWVVVVLVQIANPGSPPLHAVESLRQDLEFVPLFFFAYQLLQTSKRLDALLVILVISGALNGVVSVIQSRLTPEQLASWGPGYRGLELGTSSRVARVFVSHGHLFVRPIGLGSTDGFAGAICILALPAALALLASRRGFRQSWWLLPAIAAILAGIFDSQTRGVIVAAAIAMISFSALTLTSRRGLAVLALTVVVVGSGIGLGNLWLSGQANRFSAKENARGIATRESALAAVPSYVAKYPLGAGLGSVGPAASVLGGSEISSEDEFQYLLAETGCLGLLTMAAVFGLTLSRMLRLRRVSDPRLQRALMAIAAGLIGIMASWFAGPVSVDSPFAPFLWGAVGLTAFWTQATLKGRVALKPRLFGRRIS